MQFLNNCDTFRELWDKVNIRCSNATNSLLEDTIVSVSSTRLSAIDLMMRDTIASIS